MKKVTSVILLLLCGLVTVCRGQDTGIDKQTYLYSVKGTDSLYVDKYAIAESQPGGPSPCIIFMFGGAFFTGQRYGGILDPYFEFLASHGYTVVSIDYRLGLKPVASGQWQASDTKKTGKIKQAKAFLRIFRHAIDIAVEDLFDATAFVLENSSDWNIDPDRIIANGSSAGAISVLHGEYAICNGDPVSERLPSGFNYAGVISFAGAIFADGRDIEFRNPPCPMMLFHGDADSNVPYDRIRKLGMGFFGSKHISKKLTRSGTPHVFYSVENADHRIAGSPMTDNREDILSFLEKLVDRGERLIIDTDVAQPGVPDKKKRFRIGDYVKTNFGGTR